MTDAAHPDFSATASDSSIANESQTACRSRSVSRRRRMVGRVLLALVICGVGFAAWSQVYKPNGWLEPIFAPEFDNSVPERKPLPKPYEVYKFENPTIPREQIVFAGMNVDQIPSLTNPEFVPGEYGTHVDPNDRVIGVANGEQAKAYPIEIIAYHEAINDRLGDLPVLITFSTLCDSAAAFHRVIDGKELEFGITGMLYNSNTLLYSRTGKGMKTLWSQLKCEAVTGPQSGTKLVALPVELTTWADWKGRYPESQVLSKFTDHEETIDYAKSPAGDYLQTEELWYPAEPSDSRLPKKTPLLAVWTKNASRAYPLSAFAKVEQPCDIKQQLDGKEFTLRYDPACKSLRITEGKERVQHMYALWFAWYAFNPQTEVCDLPPTDSTSAER